MQRPPRRYCRGATLFKPSPPCNCRVRIFDPGQHAMTWLTRAAILICIPALTAPAAALEGRTYACTNIMGGNPFRLVVGESGYSVETLPESYETLSGEGNISRGMGVAIDVTSGPLLDDWKIDSLIEMSGGNLILSGDDGLRECEKSKF
jgi:hypothetical protein